uniref:SP110 nuclear body protein variant 19 n=2 Tax=Sus scrofa TaxID=9823 RepID=S5AAU1_PIG|nr:SP110 nuclear body protein variant 19 [Sus scrofa]
MAVSVSRRITMTRPLEEETLELHLLPHEGGFRKPAVSQGI